MSRFLPLTVADVRRDTRDAVVVTLEPRAGDEARFDFIQGQYLTFRRQFGGEEVRRNYSICAGRGEGVLRIGIKRVDGGTFSTWANEQLAKGDVLEAMEPMGAFHTPLDASRSRHYLAFAGGSGITPILSIMKTTLAREPKSRFSLVYANRSVGSIMFREELEDLKNLHLGRLAILHVLETDAQEIDLFTGRIDREKCAALLRHWIGAEGVDMAFICGPEPMMAAIEASLRDHGLRDEQIKLERFSAPQQGRPQQGESAAAVAAAVASAECEACVTLDGITRTFMMPMQGQSLLEAALAHGIDAPYACRAGVCASCRAMVTEGKGEMEANHALEDYEVRQGYVLTCQCHPLTRRICVSYDHR